MSERRACQVLGQHRTTQHKVAKTPDDAAALTADITRERIAIRFERKLKAVDVIDVLADPFNMRGIPSHIRSDNGPDFIAKALREWIALGGGNTAYIMSAVLRGETVNQSIQ